MTKRFSLTKYLMDIDYAGEIQKENEKFGDLYVEIVMENVFQFYRLILSGSTIKNAMEESIFKGFKGEALKEKFKELNKNYDSYISDVDQGILKAYDRVKDRKVLIEGDEVVFLDNNSYRWRLVKIKREKKTGEGIFICVYKQLDVDGGISEVFKYSIANSIEKKDHKCSIVKGGDNGEGEPENGVDSK